MNRSLILGLGLCALAPLPARTALAQPVPDRLPLSGVVRDQDGNPLASVSVTIRRQDDSGTYGFWGSETVTDAQGIFKFPTAEVGRYYLNTDKGGYAQRMNQNIDWKRGSDPLKVIMPKLADLKIRVLKADGAPLASSPAFVRIRGEGEGGQSYNRLPTDANGIGSLSQMVPDTYRFLVLAPGYGNGRIKDVALSFTPETRVVDLTLRPGGNLKVKLVEQAANGAPPKPLGGGNLMLNIVPEADNPKDTQRFFDAADNVALLAARLDRSGLVTAEGDGTINLTDLPPGKYSAQMLMPGWPKAAPKDIVIKAGETAEAEWTFESRPSGSMTALVLDKSGAPWKNRDVAIRFTSNNPNEGITTEFIPGNFPFFPGSNARRGTTDENGKLTLYPLRPGKYRFWLTSRDPDGKTNGNASTQETEITTANVNVTFNLPINLPTP